ncbi:MAG: hypothetical protein ACREL6_12140 [Gemmatimonadales bacterium]
MRLLRSGTWHFATAIAVLILILAEAAPAQGQAIGRLQVAARVVSAEPSWGALKEVQTVLRSGLEASRRRPMQDGRLAVVSRLPAEPGRRLPAGGVVYTVNYFAN